MLYTQYREEIVPQLMKELGYANVMQVPRVEKVVVNMGVGKHDDPKVLEGAMANLGQIAGQKPVVTRARRAISDFKIRQGDAIGCMVTLRGPRAYEFLYKLFNVALPGIRDFKGVSPDAFDGRGNFSIGLSEQMVFPEISYDDVVRTQGMDITIVTTARTDREGRALLAALGCAFRKE
ncbi:MAG TPA: 50S ribosomal protein L5 [Candidatus Bipolaricaulis sp.]|jgi:large subunit ribosomal protein L5|nr:50S ribosomal protein L5 [Candidatus Bipolaricaulis sp.]MDD2912412.1 50S ribosomal protein L5 [Candidatus Bipolaricaulis anaerobius]MDD5453404.1 50S ribosomal protein L5 [Candidatus Bipolaricaulis sp.]MDD5763569.1 50S ribosomal protein L5 [Candidatus Bipolaricaulis anaerobius]MDY0393038.1 50S ribosomal protein L5 [Candidatus Bipolaricaulis sp.]